MAGASEESKGIESLKNFERALGHVRNSVRPLTLMSRDEVGNCVNAADRAKLNLQVAYGVSSLFYMFLKTQGVSPLSHPVKSELDRIRGYFGRLKEVGKPPEQRTLRVDQEASRRFINAALSRDSVWQNASTNDPKSAQLKRASAGIGRTNPAGQPENIGAQTAGAASRKTKSVPAETSTGQQQQPQQQRDLNAATPGGSSSSSSSSGKRKHAAAAAAAAAAVVGAGQGVPAPSSAGARGERGSGGGWESGGRGPAAAKWGEGPEAAEPGESLPATKKPKGAAGRNNKTNARYHAW